MKKDALLYEKYKDNILHCFLCSHHCKIADEKFGFCGVRQNIGGALYTLVYGDIVARHVDPIEKSPSIISCQVRILTLSQPSDATSAAVSARTGKFRRLA